MHIFCHVQTTIQSLSQRGYFPAWLILSRFSASFLILLYADLISLSILKVPKQSQPHYFSKHTCSQQCALLHSLFWNAVFYVLWGLQKSSLSFFCSNEQMPGLFKCKELRKCLKSVGSVHMLFFNNIFLIYHYPSL